MKESDGPVLDLGVVGGVRNRAAVSRSGRTAWGGFPRRHEGPQARRLGPFPSPKSADPRNEGPQARRLEPFPSPKRADLRHEGPQARSLGPSVSPALSHCLRVALLWRVFRTDGSQCPEYARARDRSVGVRLRGPHAGGNRGARAGPSSKAIDLPGEGNNPSAVPVRERRRKAGAAATRCGDAEATRGVGGAGGGAVRAKASPQTATGHEKGAAGRLPAAVQKVGAYQKLVAAIAVQVGATHD